MATGEITRRAEQDVTDGVPQRGLDSLRQTAGLQRATAQGGGLEVVSVVKPRVLAEVEQRIKNEAALLGEDAFYSWQVNDKSSPTGKKLVEGPSIQCAEMIARNYGNCLTDCDVSETAAAIVFRARFTDHETGYTNVRPFRLDRRNMPQANYRQGRDLDIAFQIAASKAIRNVILHSTPEFLKQAAMKVAKEKLIGLINQAIKDKGLTYVQQAYCSRLISEGASEASILEKFSIKATSALSAEDLVVMLCDWRRIKSGEETIDSLYPSPVAPASDRPAADTKPETPTLDSLAGAVPF